MNKKDILEIRKIFTPENCVVTRIWTGNVSIDHTDPISFCGIWHVKLLISNCIKKEN